jgi:hypothetical protein
VTPGKPLRATSRHEMSSDTVVEARCVAHVRRASVASLRRRFERALNDAL